MSQRGDSGRKPRPRSMMSDGTPPRPSIARHPPVIPLSAPSTSDALTCPTTTAALFTDTSTPRRAGGASSA
eukprot:4294020-Prymnesium_polylepis.1